MGFKNFVAFNAIIINIANTCHYFYNYRDSLYNLGGNFGGWLEYVIY